MTLQVLRMYRGDDRTFPLTITAAGVARNLAGATFRFTAARTPDGDPVIETTDVAIVSAPAGTVTLTIDAAETAELEVPTVWPTAWRWPYWTHVPYLTPRRYEPFLRLYWDIEVTIGGLKRTWPEDTNGRPRLGHLLVFADQST